MNKSKALKSTIILMSLFWVSELTAQDSTKIKKNGGYAMIGVSFTSVFGSGFGGSINAGYKGGKYPAIGIGLEVIKTNDLNTAYLPIYIDIRPFFKNVFGIFQVGYAGPVQQTLEGRSKQTGGFYAAAGAGAVFSKKRVSPFISIKAARMPYYINNNSLSEVGFSVNFGVKF